jgi:hypothetical protein
MKGAWLSDPPALLLLLLLLCDTVAVSAEMGSPRHTSRGLLQLSWCVLLQEL